MELETAFFNTIHDVVDMEQGDVSRLNDLQLDLHEQLLNSPLCDTASFVDQLEASYRNIWRDWCEKN